MLLSLVTFTGLLNQLLLQTFCHLISCSLAGCGLGSVPGAKEANRFQFGFVSLFVHLWSRHFQDTTDTVVNKRSACAVKFFKSFGCEREWRDRDRGLLRGRCENEIL